MKEKGKISRKQFIAGSATLLFSSMLAKLSGQSYAVEKTQTEVNDTAQSFPGWEQLPIDYLPGVCLVSDSNSVHFGETYEQKAGTLTQYIHVYPGLKLLISSSAGINWVGYSKSMRPDAALRRQKEDGSSERVMVTIPEGVYYIRGCSSDEDLPCVWVKDTALYLMNCGLNKPDTSSYTEITGLTFDQRSRKYDNGAFDEDTQDCPSIGDMFFSPAGTEIIITFNNANIAPYIQAGENFTSTASQRAFTGHYGFGYAWYHCRTPDICCALGAYYETAEGWAKKLTVEELKAADPHLYIKFPSTAANTLAAARCRTINLKKRSQRRFTVVHLTDIHGDMDSTQAAYAYADHIGADLVALTGDYVSLRWYHGCNILHTIIRNAKTPTVYSLGNHDVAKRTDKQAYAQNIAPIRDVLQASGEHAYYYRDFDADGETVRVISLYPFRNHARQREKGYYDEAQLRWLCDTLASTPGGGHIFILRHFSHCRPVIPEGEAAMFYDYSGTSDSAKTWLNMDSDPVKDIVDAYTKREKIIAYYMGELSNDAVEAVTVKYDFTNRPNSEFVAYFTGHVHVDHVGYVRDTRTPQVILGSLCTTGVKGSEEYSLYTALSTPRDYGTDSQIAFNVFTFDFEQKKIYAARVGNGKFRDREKTWTELSYQ